MIYDPVTIRRGSTVADALAMMEEYHIGGIPVVDDDKMLVGIVTNRDLRFERDLSRKIDEVMTSENIITTKQSTNLEEAAQILQQHKIENFPLSTTTVALSALSPIKTLPKPRTSPTLARTRLAACVWQPA